MITPETEAPSPQDEERPREQDREDDTARFDDPYWDDAFCAWWDPALRTCCG